MEYAVRVICARASSPVEGGRSTDRETFKKSIIIWHLQITSKLPIIKDDHFVQKVRIIT